MRTIIRRHTARETALLLVQLCAIGGALRGQGLCAGELHPADIYLSNGTLQRTHAGRMRGVVYQVRQTRHLRHGHDLGCQTIGVPLSTVRRMTRHWAGDNTVDYLVEAVELALAQLAAGEWPGYLPAQVVKYEIGRRLTIESPADFVVPESVASDR